MRRQFAAILLIYQDYTPGPTGEIKEDLSKKIAFSRPGKQFLVIA
jgi:hypothetical protein